MVRKLSLVLSMALIFTIYLFFVDNIVGFVSGKEHLSYQSYIIPHYIRTNATTVVAGFLFIFAFCVLLYDKIRFKVTRNQTRKWDIIITVKRVNREEVSNGK